MLHTHTNAYTHTHTLVRMLCFAEINSYSSHGFTSAQLETWMLCRGVNKSSFCKYTQKYKSQVSLKFCYASLKEVHLEDSNWGLQVFFKPCITTYWIFLYVWVFLLLLWLHLNISTLLDILIRHKKKVQSAQPGCEIVSKLLKTET